MRDFRLKLFALAVAFSVYFVSAPVLHELSSLSKLQLRRLVMKQLICTISCLHPQYCAGASVYTFGYLKPLYFSPMFNAGVLGED